MPAPRFSLSRVSTLGFALGGTAIQLVEKLGPTVSDVCPWIGPLSIVAGALAGFGFNRIAAAADKNRELQDATRDLLTNQDIALAQARAIEARLRRYADQLGGGKGDAFRLLAIAQTAETWWMAIVSDPTRAEVAKVRDDQIVGELTPYLSGQDQLIFDASLWTELLIEADKLTPGEPKLTPDLAAYFAAYLAGDFTHDFVEALKTDFQTDGKAYAAVSLRFFGEILSGIRAVAQTEAELEPFLQRLPELLAEAQKAVQALRAAGVSQDLDTALSGTEGRLADAIYTLRLEMHGRFDQLEKVVAELREALRLRGVTPTDLSREELERELASRTTGLSPEELRRLVESARFQADISRIIKYAPAELLGREAETGILADAWSKAVRGEPQRPHILTFVALGGEGKTSLVAKWAADLAAQDWPGCDAVFAWSFYSQGTREQTAVSSDLFLAEALTFFGDAAMAGSAQGAFEKGKRLAQLVGERRALLILDGLEPLQYAPTSPTPGELKDQGLSALLKGLAATSHGLCVVTTRYALPDLRAFLGRTVREEKLARLARAAGVQLLKAHGVTGSDRRNLPLHDGDAKSELVSEFEKLVEDVDGHALTLHIMGSFLKKAFGGDIRKRDRVTFAKASQKTDNDHAFRAMAAYARWMEDGSDEARRELAILRLMGLFDRPATADCLAALLAAPAIPGLTEPLTGLPEEDWNSSLESLVAAKLLSVSPETVSDPAFAFPLPASLDAHPLIREYFEERLKDEDKRMKAEGAPPSSFIPHPSSFQLAHRRLYEHLCASTQEGDQPTLEALQPLYQAVAHGCQAGLQQEAAEKIFFTRILQGNEKYAVHKLGAFGSNLGAIACFFETPWSRICPTLTAIYQAWLLTEAAFTLRALGRLTEALEPIRAGLKNLVSQKDWERAAATASNLSELELTLGEVAGAVGDAEQSVTYADRSGEGVWDKVSARIRLADAQLAAGKHAEAEKSFTDIEAELIRSNAGYRWLPGNWGCRHDEVRLAETERWTWREMLGTHRDEDVSRFVSIARSVAARASERMEADIKAGQPLLDIALDHLTLGRAALYAAILDSPDSALRIPHSELDSAVSGLRRAGTTHWIPAALLTRAWLRSLTGTLTFAQAGPDSAQSDLDEAWEIAERGPMPLFMADIHLYRARLFGRRKAEGGGRKKSDGGEDEYPWESVEKDLAEARRLIEKHGYLRRMEELEDAERALLS